MSQSHYQPGDHIAGRYEVVSKPMMGGMGVVYFCHDRKEDRPMALKTFKPEYLSNRAARDRFLHEGSYWVELGPHPHIVRCHRVLKFGVSGEIYLVLELIAKVQGREDASLRSWLTPGRSLPLEQALLFALQIARGMQHATTIIPGFVHRDLKPENILVGADKLDGANRLRITDFGLAAVLEETRGSSAEMDAGPEVPETQNSAIKNRWKRIQLTRGIVGTPLYMAPEQWRGEAVSTATDIYALGCILYEMFSGKKLGVGQNLSAIKRAHCDPTRPKLPTGLPINVTRLVQRCLVVNSEERYRDWELLTTVLKEAYEGVTGKVVPGVATAVSLNRIDEVATGWSYNAIGASYMDLGEAALSQNYFERALTVGRDKGDHLLTSAALTNLGDVYRNLGDTQRAIDFSEQALTISQEIGDRWGQGAPLIHLGLAYVDLGEMRQAIGYYEQALAISQELDDQQGQEAALADLGSAYRYLGDARRAIDFFERALTIAREISNRRGEGNILANLGVAYFTLGDIRQAIDFYEQALAIARETGDRRGEENILGNLGVVYGSLGEVQQGINFFEQYLQIAREIGDRRGESSALGNLGNIYFQLKDTPQAITLFEQALAIAREIGDRRGESNALGNLGNIRLQMGEVEQAIRFYEKQLVITREIGDRMGEGTVLGNLGVAYKNQGDMRRASSFFEQSLAIKREIGDLMGLANDSFNIALLYAKQDRFADALHYAEQAVLIVEEMGHTEKANQARQLVAHLQGHVAS